MLNPIDFCSSSGRRFGFTLILLLALSGGVLGCQSESADSASSEKIQIAVIPKGTTHQFWKSIHAGANKAAHDHDVEIIWQGPQKEDDRQMQIQVVQNFISRGIDVIVLAPLDARSLAGPVQAAVRRGIPVVIIDSNLDSDAHTSFIATDNRLGGALSAERLSEVLGGRGDVILLRYQEGSASTTNREEGFLARIKEVAPEINILTDTQYAGATIEKALQVSQNLLNRYPDVDGIFCPNESTVQGMLRALQTAGKVGAIRLVGFDANETLIEGLRNREIDGLAVQDPFNMAYAGVETAAAIARGEAVDSLVNTRVLMITPDNIDTPEAQALLNPDLAQWLDE